MTTSHSSNERLLRINVGFLLKQGAGYSRKVSFDYPDNIKAGDIILSHLKGTLRLTRTPQGILVQGTLQTSTEVKCVRCLTLFNLPFHVEISELFIPQSAATENADPDTYIIDDGNSIDLTPIIREEGILAIPMQALCSPDCKGLCAQCGQDLNEGSCDCEADRIDPRLASLRTLLED